MPTVIFKNKYLWLLLSLVAFFMVTPLIVNSQADMYVFGILFSIVLYVGIVATLHSRWLIIAGAVLATLIFISVWVNNLFIENPVLLGIEYCLMAVYFFMILVAVLYSILKGSRVSFNSICGALCGYLLLGMTWSFFYSLVYYFQSGAFNFPDVLYVVFDSHFQRFTYYSFVTLTTLGYGDITPISNLAKTLSWLEAVAGQVYLTVWIALLVGMHLMHKMRTKGN